MRKFTNQRGLAVLEVVIVAAIVAIFATVAVPKMARIYDKVQLDYEMKRLCSTFHFARSIGKNSEGNVKFIVSQKSNKYHISSQVGYSSTKHYEYFLPENFDLSFKDHPSDDILQVTFNNPGMYSDNGSKIKTIFLTSRLKYEAQIIANTVGRWRGTYDK